MQTEPPPPYRFSVNVGEGDIYGAYESDQLALQRLEQEKEEKKKDKDAKKVVCTLLIRVFLCLFDHAQYFLTFPNPVFL